MIEYNKYYHRYIENSTIYCDRSSYPRNLPGQWMNTSRASCVTTQRCLGGTSQGFCCSSVLLEAQRLGVDFAWFAPLKETQTQKGPVTNGCKWGKVQTHSVYKVQASTRCLDSSSSLILWKHVNKRLVVTLILLSTTLHFRGLTLYNRSLKGSRRLCWPLCSLWSGSSASSHGTVPGSWRDLRPQCPGVPRISAVRLQAWPKTIHTNPYTYT